MYIKIKTYIRVTTTQNIIFSVMVIIDIKTNNKNIENDIFLYK